MPTTLDIAYPYILERSGEPARLARHPRFRVSHIVADQQHHGLSAAEICEEYPGLAPGDIYAAMLYYSDHREEIDREIAVRQEEWRRWEAEKGTAPPSKIEGILFSRKSS